MPWYKVDELQLEERTRYLVSDGAECYELFWFDGYWHTQEYVPMRIMGIKYVYIFKPEDVLNDNPDTCTHEWEDTDCRVCTKCGYWETS